MPVGIITNASVILFGGLIGTALGRHLPDRVRQALPLTFGFCSMTIGISLIIKMENLSAVILATILGTFLGEWLDIEDKLSRGTVKLQSAASALQKGSTPANAEHTQKFVGLLVLFCTSSTGILGAMAESMSGDSSILIAKSVLDLFTSIIFSSTLGLMVSAIAGAQLTIFLLIFFLAEFIAPLTTPALLNDFVACGGIITLATGFRLGEIKHVRVANMLPAIFLVMPISALWPL